MFILLLQSYKKYLLNVFTVNNKVVIIFDFLLLPDLYTLFLNLNLGYKFSIGKRYTIGINLKQIGLL